MYLMPGGEINYYYTVSSDQLIIYNLIQSIIKLLQVAFDLLCSCAVSRV